MWLRFICTVILYWKIHITGITRKRSGHNRMTSFKLHRHHTKTFPGQSFLTPNTQLFLYCYTQHTINHSISFVPVKLTKSREFNNTWCHCRSCLIPCSMAIGVTKVQRRRHLIQNWLNARQFTISCQKWDWQTWTAVYICNSQPPPYKWPNKPPRRARHRP